MNQMVEAMKRWAPVHNVDLDADVQTITKEDLTNLLATMWAEGTEYQRDEMLYSE